MDTEVLSEDADNRDSLADVAFKRSRQSQGSVRESAWIYALFARLLIDLRGPFQQLSVSLETVESR